LFGRIALLMHNFDIGDPPNSLWSTFGDLFDKEAFHGAGQELELELQPGTQVNSSLVRFLEPDIFRTQFNPWSFEFEWRRYGREEEFYHEDRNDKRVRFGHQFTRKFSGYIGYTTANVRVTDIDSPLTGLNDPVVPPLPDSIYQQEGKTNLSGITLDFTLRNVDQFLNPHSGNQYGWHSIFYDKSLGGDYDFVKSTINGDWFWLTGDENGEEVQPGFHLGLDAGIADPYGDTTMVPYTERFFLGGSRTLRGFDRRGVGPNRGNNTLGGETALWGTFEYRYPLYSVTEPGTYRQKETFRLTLFTDAGVLGVDAWNIDPNEVRWTYGFGLGMVQPFPVSLNFGFPIKDGEGDRKQVFSFTILSLWF
jgi:outer membrane protein insertion porin family